MRKGNSSNLERKMYWLMIGRKKEKVRINQYLEHLLLRTLIKKIKLWKCILVRLKIVIFFFFFVI